VQGGRWGKGLSAIEHLAAVARDELLDDAVFQ
jgi:hypothetical protein